MLYFLQRRGADVSVIENKTPPKNKHQEMSNSDTNIESMSEARGCDSDLAQWVRASPLV